MVELTEEKLKAFAYAIKNEYWYIFDICFN